VSIWRNVDYFSTLALKRACTLPGVFDHDRFGHDICAPLWTLPLEVRCYLLVLVTGMPGLLSTPRRCVIAVLLCAIAFALRVELRDFPDKAGGYSFFPESFFFLGVLLYGWREHVRIDGFAALGLLLVFLVFRDMAGARVLFYIAFVYGVLWIGTTPLLRNWVPRRDYSTRSTCMASWFSNAWRRSHRPCRRCSRSWSARRSSSRRRRFLRTGSSVPRWPGAARALRAARRGNSNAASARHATVRRRRPI